MSDLKNSFYALKDKHAVQRFTTANGQLWASGADSSTIICLQVGALVPVDEQSPAIE